MSLELLLFLKNLYNKAPAIPREPNPKRILDIEEGASFLDRYRFLVLL